MERINDISFTIGDKLVVLIEHLSTLGPNVALRILMYISRIYEKIFEGKNIYSTKKLQIPEPEFYVLYNGKEPLSKDMILKLSDSYVCSHSDKSNEPFPYSLDLKVKVININEGRNE